MSSQIPIIPPPPCETLSLREWLTGCTLSNSSLIKNGTPSEVGQRAVAIADEAILALRQAPVVDDVEPPTEARLQAWEARLAINTIRTEPAGPMVRKQQEISSTLP